MIGDHVAEGTRLFVKRSAILHSQCFSGSDLDVVDVIAVPDRLEHRVAKAEHHDVLNRFFAEIMVDAINRIFGKDMRHDVVQFLGALQIMAKRFLQNDSRPALAVAGQT